MVLTFLTLTSPKLNMCLEVRFSLSISPTKSTQYQTRIFDITIYGAMYLSGTLRFEARKKLACSCHNPKSL